MYLSSATLVLDPVSRCPQEAQKVSTKTPSLSIMDPKIIHSELFRKNPFHILMTEPEYCVGAVGGILQTVGRLVSMSMYSRTLCFVSFC